MCPRKYVCRSSYKAIFKTVVSKCALQGLEAFFFSTTSKRQILLIPFGQTDGAAVIVVPRDSESAENDEIRLKDGFVNSQNGWNSSSVNYM
jgi:hypothetical protein